MLRALLSPAKFGQALKVGELDPMIEMTAASSASFTCERNGPPPHPVVLLVLCLAFVPWFLVLPLAVVPLLSFVILRNGKTELSLSLSDLRESTSNKFGC